MGYARWLGIADLVACFFNVWGRGCHGVGDFTSEGVAVLAQLIP